MPDEPQSPALDTELTTNIVAAYVWRNCSGRYTRHLVFDPVNGPRADAAVRSSVSVDKKRPYPN